MSRQCECCDNLAISGIKYCKRCRKEILEELRDAGYLETRGYGGHRGQQRTAGMKENEYETKHGTGH